jgi:hypothetical protein
MHILLQKKAVSNVEFVINAIYLGIVINYIWSATLVSSHYNYAILSVDLNIVLLNWRSNSFKPSTRFYSRNTVRGDFFPNGQKTLIADSS